MNYFAPIDFLRVTFLALIRSSQCWFWRLAMHKKRWLTQFSTWRSKAKIWFEPIKWRDCNLSLLFGFNQKKVIFC